MMISSRLRPGWPAGIAAALLSCVLAAAIALTADELNVLVSRLAVAAAVISVLAVAMGSEGLLGFATAPMLVAAFLGSDGADGPAWGRSAIIGCLWFVTAELGWFSIDRRSGESPIEDEGSADIVARRTREVATVATVSLTIGVAAAGSALVAPTRSLLVMGLLVAALLIALTGTLRQLARPDKVEQQPRT